MCFCFICWFPFQKKIQLSEKKELASTRASPSVSQFTLTWTWTKVVSKGTHLDLDHYGWMDWTGPIEVFDWMDDLDRRLLEASWMWMVGTGGFKGTARRIRDSGFAGFMALRISCPWDKQKAEESISAAKQGRTAASMAWVPSSTGVLARVRVCARSRVQDGTHACQPKKNPRRRGRVGRRREFKPRPSIVA
jgi:hypothetical protein